MKAFKPVTTRPKDKITSQEAEMNGRNVLAHIRHKRAEEKRKSIIDMRKSVAARVAAQVSKKEPVAAPEADVEEPVPT